MKTITTIVFLTILLLVPGTAESHVITKQQCYSYAKTQGAYRSPAWRKALRKCRKYAKQHAWNHRCRGVAKTIRCVFGRYGEQAVSVARCESGLNVNAKNGEYLGLFQMGSSERARYGHGPTALKQSRAAYAYFADTGFSWRPWSCKP